MTSAPYPRSALRGCGRMKKLLAGVVVAGSVVALGVGLVVTATNANAAVAAPQVGATTSVTTFGVGVEIQPRFLIENYGTLAYTGSAVTFYLSAGLTYSTDATGITNQCGGTITSAAGSNTLTYSSGSLPANTGCYVVFNAFGATAGSYSIAINAGQVTTTNAGSNPSGSQVTAITVNANPSVSKGFAPTAIGVGGTSVLSINVGNPNPVAIHGVAVTDNLPSGLTVATPANVNNSCAGGTLTATSGTVTITYTGGTAPPTPGCTIQVNVTATTAGSYTNTIPVGGVTTTDAGNNTTATSATLVVSSNPVPVVYFGAANTPMNTPVVMALAVENFNTSPMTGVTFSDPLPTGLTVAATGTYTACGATLSFTAGATSVSLTGAGATVPASNNCTYQVSVVSPTPGSYTDTFSTISSTNDGNATASSSATLTVATTPIVSIGFMPASIGAGGTSTLTITLTNSNNFALTGVAATDNLPAGVTVASPAGITVACTGGTVSAAAGATVITYSGGGIPASSGCTIQVNVTSATAGTYTNTIPVGGVTTTNAGSNTIATSATITVTAPVFTQRNASRAVWLVGQTATYVVTVTNSGSSSGSVSWADAVPANVSVTSTTCTGSCTASTSANNVSGTMTLAVGESERFTITVLVATPSTGPTADVAVITSTSAGATGGNAQEYSLYLR